MRQLQLANLAVRSHPPHREPGGAADGDVSDVRPELRPVLRNDIAEQLCADHGFR